jgi:hypothetical protein
LAAVEAGEVSVSDASKIVRRPHPVQRLALEAFRAKKGKTLVQALKVIEPDLPVLDGRGLPVPAAYRDVFATRDESDDLIREFDEIRAEVEALASGRAGFYLRKELKHLVEKFGQIKSALKAGNPQLKLGKAPQSKRANTRRFGVARGGRRRIVVAAIASLGDQPVAPSMGSGLALMSAD